MKIRIGVGIGAGTDLSGDYGAFGHIVDDLEGLGFDSLWVTERVSSPTLDPIVAMAYAASRTTRLKIGTSVMVLPGRNPVLLAKAIASLDQLSGGRILPAFGLGVVAGPEQQAFGVARTERVPWFDEALPLLRRLWTEDRVTHHGERFHLDDVQVLPKPRQGHVDVWLGGAAPAELRRAGRLGDGWLPSFATPAAVRDGIARVNDAAAAAGRTIDPEHFGVLIAYTHGAPPPQVAQLVAARDPSARVDDVVPSGVDAVAGFVERYVEVGASKFVVLPLDTPPDWRAELEQLATAVLPLQRVV